MAGVVTALDGLSPRLRAATGLSARFRRARPYCHLALDGFLDEGLAAALRRDLRALRIEPAPRDLNGTYNVARAGADLGPGFRRVRTLLASPQFVDWVSRATGIAGLEHNAHESAGGLFVSGDGDEMDIHLDPNGIDFHCSRAGRTRSLNMFLYLNEGWQDAWGGKLELFREPSRPAAQAFSPLFNRCVIADIHDRSWHAVSRVTLPPKESRRRRFLFVTNFGSRTAPEGGPNSRHYNIFMPRPLPPAARPGRVLSLPAALEIAELLRRRRARLSELRRVIAASEGRETPPEAAPSGNPLDALALLPPSVRPGRALTAAAHAELKSLFARRDEELRRCYARQYAAVERLRRVAPGRLPGWARGGGPAPVLARRTRTPARA